jgi:hypothetical protein
MLNSLVLFLTLCGNPTGILTESADPLGGPPTIVLYDYTASNYQKILKGISEDTAAGKLEIAPVLGFKCTKA